MIVSAILKLVVAAISWVFSFLPAIPMGWASGVGSVISTFVAAFHAIILPWNYYVPLHLWITLFLIFVPMEVGFLIWSCVLFIWGEVRGTDHG